MCPIKECHCVGHSRSSRPDSSTLRSGGCSPSDWVWKGMCVCVNCCTISINLFNGYYNVLCTNFNFTKYNNKKIMHLGELLKMKNCMKKERTCWVKYSTSDLFWWAITTWWAEKYLIIRGWPQIIVQACAEVRIKVYILWNIHTVGRKKPTKQIWLIWLLTCQGSQAKHLRWLAFPTGCSASFLPGQCSCLQSLLV